MTKTMFAVAALLVLSGCHSKSSKPAAGPVRLIEFTLDPNAAAKTLTVQCVSSSSGKCAFAFAGGTPAAPLLDPGATVTIAGVEPAAMYCYGPRQLSIDTCHKRPLPETKTTVTKDKDPASEAPAAN